MNVVSSAKREGAGELSRGGGSAVREAGRSPHPPGTKLVVKPDKELRVDDDPSMLGVELHVWPTFGATDGAGKIGVPGPTLGIPHALPPGYIVIGMAVVLLVPKLMMLDVVSVEVKPVSVL